MCGVVASNGIVWHSRHSTTHLLHLDGLPIEHDAVELDQVVVCARGEHGGKLHSNVTRDVNVAQQQYAVALHAAKAHGKHVVNLLGANQLWA